MTETVIIRQLGTSSQEETAAYLPTAFVIPPIPLMRLPNPRDDFAQTGLATELLDGAVAQHGISERTPQERSLLERASTSAFNSSTSRE